MNRKTIAVIGLAVVVAVASIALAAAPVSAQSDEDTEDSVMDTLFGDEADTEDVDRWELIKAAASGILDKYNPFADRPEQASATEYRDRLQSTFNDDSGVLVNWTNARTNASEDMDVARVKVEDESGNTAYLFLVTDVNTTTGNYTSLRAMNASEFQSLDRDVDTTVRMSAYASRNANAELETFVADYAEPDKNMSKSYLSHIAAEYRGEITGEAIPGGEN